MDVLVGLCWSRRVAAENRVPRHQRVLGNVFKVLVCFGLEARVGDGVG